MIRVVLTAVVLVLLSVYGAMADPLVKGNNFSYLGAIKTPAISSGSMALSYGGQVITYNPTNNSLFITGAGQGVAELSLPAPVYSSALLGSTPIASTALSTLNTASTLQNFSDITEGNRKSIISNNTGTDAVITSSGGTSVVTIPSLDLSSFNSSQKQGRAIRITGGTGFTIGSYPVVSSIGNAVTVTGNVGTSGSSGGSWVEEYNGSVYLGGLLRWGSGLIGTSFSYYDGSDGAVQRSHFKSSTSLSTTGDYVGMYQVSGLPTVASVSYLSGFMSLVADNSGSGGTNWQSQLGGPALTGNGTLSVLSRTSYGPAAFSFDPDRLGIDSPVVANPLLYYSSAHQTLGPDGVDATANPYFNGTTKISGMVMVPGTKSVLFFGYHGLGPYGYGDFTSVPEQIGTNCNGEGYCYYDPTGMGNKGPHAYPYVYQVWAYNADDLASAKTGTYTVTQGDFDAGRFVGGVYPNNTILAVGQTVNPWNIKPYAVWTLPFKFAYTQIFGGGAAFDPNTGRLYISEPGALLSGCCDVLPLIHVFQLDIGASPASTYKIGGRSLLLNGSVTLHNNGGDPLVVTAASRTTLQSFNFTNQLAPGNAYNITIASQPANQTCTVFNGSGTVAANADIDNVVISCTGAGGGGSPPANGVCGSANGGTFSSAPTTNLCTTGTASSVTVQYTWTCAGSNGGTTANCSATYQAPQGPSARIWANLIGLFR